MRASRFCAYGKYIQIIYFSVRFLHSFHHLFTSTFYSFFHFYIFFSFVLQSSIHDAGVICSMYLFVSMFWLFFCCCTILFYFYLSLLLLPMSFSLFYALTIPRTVSFFHSLLARSLQIWEMRVSLHYFVMVFLRSWCCCLIFCAYFTSSSRYTVLFVIIIRFRIVLFFIL